MEFLFALAPIALILSLCGGMMFFMMRGMHSGAARGSAHEMHGEEATGGVETERLRQLESEVALLQEEAAITTKGSNGTEPAIIAPDPAGTKSDS